MREPVAITFIVASGDLKIPLNILFLLFPFWWLALLLYNLEWIYSYLSCFLLFTFPPQKQYSHL